MPIQHSGWRGAVLFGGALLVSVALAMYVGTTIAKPVQTLIADAHALVVKHAHWQTQANGGRGAVREVCELIMHAQGTLDMQLNGFIR